MERVNQQVGPCTQCKHVVGGVVGHHVEFFCNHPDAPRQKTTGAVFPVEFMRGVSGKSYFCADGDKFVRQGAELLADVG